MKCTISVSLLILSIACLTRNASAQNWIKINKAAYSIQSPPGWIADSSKQMGTDLVLFSMPENSLDKFRENITIVVRNTSGKNIGLAKYTGVSEGQIKAMARDAHIELSKTIQSGATAYQKIIYTATQGGGKLKFEQYNFVHAGKAWAVTLTTEAGKFEQYKSTGEQVLNSFVLK